MRLSFRYLTLPMAAFGLSETAAIFASPYLATWLSPGEAGWRVGFIDLVRVAGYTFVMSLSLIALGVYRRRRETLTEILLRVGLALCAGTVVVGCASFFLHRRAFSRSILFNSLLVAFVLVGVIRTVYERMADDNTLKRRVLAIGAGKRAATISQLRRRSDLRGFFLVGFIPAEGDQLTVPAERLIAPQTDLRTLCERERIDEIVVAIDDRRRNFPVHELLDCRIAGVEVIDVVDFLERETGTVRLDVLNPSWIIFSPGFSRSPLRRFTKRAFDVVASLLLLAVAWPVMLLAALAIKIEDGWRAPIFYRQVRVGLEGRHFSVLKFRSMRVDAEQASARWAVEGDSRITRFGKFARKTRIDELPQILNVLKRDMSFVGPRPERPEFVATLGESIPYFKERHYVEPGITGWAQLCYPYGASEHDAYQKLQYDLYYLKNQSLMFDLLILLQTVEVVIWRRGAR